MSNIPTHLRYTKEHEWIRIEGSKGYIGITDFAQKELGDIVFVELPDSGGSLAAHEVFGTVESVKTVSDLYSPIAGKIVDINQALADHPEKVNEDPYGDGWMIAVEIGDLTEADQLMSSEAYAELIKE